MRILGIGIDLISNKRIYRLLRNKNFIKRTFGKNELKISKKNKNKTNFFAKRFAAKEALAKSIGTGFRNNLNFKDIEIFDIFLSISDEKDYSSAFTILQIK